MFSLAAAAAPLQVTSLQRNQTKAREGDRLTGHVTLSEAAPAGGVTLIFEPAFKLEIPMTVQVPAGETGVDFPVAAGVRSLPLLIHPGLRWVIQSAGPCQPGLHFEPRNAELR